MGWLSYVVGSLGAPSVLINQSCNLNQFQMNPMTRFGQLLAEAEESWQSGKVPQVPVSSHG